MTVLRMVIVSGRCYILQKVFANTLFKILIVSLRAVVWRTLL